MNKELEAVVILQLQECRDNGAYWKELRELIDTLEENEAEASGERHFTEPGAWSGGFAKNH